MFPYRLSTSKNTNSAAIEIDKLYFKWQKIFNFLLQWAGKRIADLELLFLLKNDRKNIFRAVAQF